MNGPFISNTEFVSFREAHARLGAARSGLLSSHVATRSRSPDFMVRGMFLPNPAPILKKMGKDIEVYRSLRSDAHTGGCIRRRKAAVKALEWRIQRGKASARMTRIVQAVFDGLDLDTLLNQLLDAVLFGYQPLEVIWQEQDGRAPLPARIIGKPPEWFLFDDEARLRFRSRDAWMQGELLPERKFLLAQQEATYANPYGFADLSMCFWPVTFKRGGLRYWVKFAEKYGMPWAVGKQPRNSPKPETEALLDQLEAMIEDAVAVIPNDASVEMLQATGASGNADAYRELLMFCRSEVAIALLGQNQSTEADSTHASAMAGLGVTYELRDGDKRLVEGVLNTQLIRWIVDLHEGQAAPAPYFELWEQEEVNKAQAERDEILARTGVQFTPAYFKRVYELQDEDIQAVSPPAAGLPPAGGAAFAEGTAAPVAAGGPDALDALIDAELADWQAVMSPMADPLRALMEQASAKGWTAQQLLDALPQTLVQMNVSALQAVLTRLGFAARGGAAAGIESD